MSIITLNVNGSNAPTKTETEWMDTRIRLIHVYMLSTRNPL